MQALMFMAGANSIFNGDKLLTTPNPEFNEDTKVQHENTLVVLVKLLHDKLLQCAAYSVRKPER
jgi:biotin synthase-like enzyme